jgi:hypothetical protein
MFPKGAGMSQEGSETDKKRDRTIAAAVIGAVAIIGAALITVFLSQGGGNGASPTPSSITNSAPTTDLSHSPVPSTNSAASGSTQASGSITYPVSGAADVPSPKTLTAAGTVQHLEPGHHLLVFLQFGNQQKYFGGDPDVVVSPTGHWSGTLCVGDPGAIELWLVDMGPEGFAALEDPAHNYWGNGVPFLPSKLAPHVIILDRVSITAARTATTCSKHEPQYYG